MHLQQSTRQKVKKLISCAFSTARASELTNGSKSELGLNSFSELGLNSFSELGLNSFSELGLNSFSLESVSGLKSDLNHLHFNPESLKSDLNDIPPDLNIIHIRKRLLENLDPKPLQENKKIQNTDRNTSLLVGKNKALFKAFRNAIQQKEQVPAWMKFLGIANDKELVQHLETSDIVSLILVLDDDNLSRWSFIKETLEKANIPQSLEIYEAVISCLAHHINFADLSTIFNEMKEKGLNLSLDAFNSIMRAFTTKSLSDVLFITNLIQESGYQLNQDSFTTLILSCTKHNDFDMALKLYQDMKSISVEPNSIIMNELIIAACKTEKKQLALDLFNEARELKLANNYIYSSILRMLLASHDNNQVNDILSSMEADDITLDLPLLSVIIQALLRRGYHIKAMSLLETMKRKGIYPDSYLLLTIIRLLISGKKVDYAYAFVQDCPKQGFTITMEMYLSLIEGLSEGDDLEKIINIYDIIQKSLYKVNIQRTGKGISRVYNRILESAANKLDAPFFNRVWNDFHAFPPTKYGTGPAPNIQTYHIGIRFFTATRNIQEAIKCVQKILELGARVSTQDSIELVQAAVQGKKYQEAAQALSILTRGKSMNISSRIMLEGGKKYHDGFSELLVRLYETEASKGDQSENSASLLQMRKAYFSIIDIYNLLLADSASVNPASSDTCRAPSEKVLFCVMDSYRRLDDLVGVVKIWSVVDKLYEKPAVKIIECLTTAANRLGQKKTALAIKAVLLDSKNSSRYQLNLACFQSLISLIIKHSDITDVPKLMLEMNNRGIEIDYRTWDVIKRSMEWREIEQKGNRQKDYTYLFDFVNETFPESLSPPTD